MKKLFWLPVLLVAASCAPETPPTPPTVLYIGESEASVLSKLRTPDARWMDGDVVIDGWKTSADDVPLFMPNPRRLFFKDDKLMGYKYLWRDVQVKYK